MFTKERLTGKVTIHDEAGERQVRVNIGRINKRLAHELISHKARLDLINTRTTYNKALSEWQTYKTNGEVFNVANGLHRHNLTGVLTIINQQGEHYAEDRLAYYIDRITRAELNDSPDLPTLRVLKERYQSALNKWQERTDQFDVILSEYHSSEGYIVDTLRNHVFIQTEAGFKAVVDVVAAYDMRINAKKVSGDLIRVSMMEIHREKYVNAIVEWETKKLTKEIDAMPTNTTIMKGLTETETPDGIKVEIYSDYGKKLSIDQVGIIHRELSGLAVIPPKRHLFLLDRLDAHMAAQREWINRPVVDEEGLKEFAQFVVDYSTIPAAELEEKYPKLCEELEDMRDRWDNLTKPDPKAYDAVSAFHYWFVLPKMKKLLGLAT